MILLNWLISSAAYLCSYTLHWNVFVSFRKSLPKIALSLFLLWCSFSSHIFFILRKLSANRIMLKPGLGMWPLICHCRLIFLHSIAKKDSLQNSSLFHCPGLELCLTPSKIWASGVFYSASRYSPCISWNNNTSPKKNRSILHVPIFDQIKLSYTTFLVI